MANPFSSRLATINADFKLAKLRLFTAGPAPSIHLNVDLLISFVPFSSDWLVWQAALLSLLVTVTAVAAAALLGVPLGVWLGRWKARTQWLCRQGPCNPGQRARRMLQHRLAVATTLVFRAAMAFPTVFVGVCCFGLFSRQGPLGAWGLLYTPWAIIVGEWMLALPIVVSLVQQPVAELDRRESETLRTLRVGWFRRQWILVRQCQAFILLAILTAFARCITELGIAMIVGGNIKGQTRTLATATAMEVSQGEFERAWSMGLLLLAISLVANLLAYLFQPNRGRPTASGSPVAQAVDASAPAERSGQGNEVKLTVAGFFDAKPDGDTVAVKPATDALVLENLAIQRDAKVVCQVSHLRLAWGNKYVLLGANGSGKSTLMGALAGLEPTVKIGLGEPRTLVHQTPWLFNMSVAGNLSLALPTLAEQRGWKVWAARGAAIAQGAGRADSRRPTKEPPASGADDRMPSPRDSLQLLERLTCAFGLDELLARTAGGLSGGERRRLAIVRAVVALHAQLKRQQVPSSRALLLLDEPFSDLDSHYRGILAALLAELPLTIVVATPVPLADLPTFVEIQPLQVD